MELEQYNFKKFQEGLTDILKNPWKKPICIQDSIPTFPVEDTNEDRLMHNLIMLQFINERLLYPYYSTVGYLLLNKMYFLKYILKTYPTKEDFVAMFKGSSRLTSNEIYEAFNGMSPSNASFLLDRIDCPVSVYTRLKESLEKKEETKFVEAIDKCNLSNILPALKYILFVKQQLKEFDSHDPQGNEGTDMSIETIKQKMHYEIETELTEKHGISPNSSLKQNFMSLWDELFELAYNPNELLESFYPPLFCQYCQMKKGGGLNDSDVKAFEYIFHQPAFEEQYERCMKLWETGELEGLFTKRSEEDSQNEDGSKEGFDSVAANKKEQQLTPQIEEPQTSKSPAEIEAQKESERKRKEAEAFNLIKELLANTAGEKDFFKDGFTLEQLIMFFKKILTDEKVLDALTKTDKRMIWVYKEIVLEKFCNIIGYLICKGVISDVQVQVANALFGMEETKTAILNWKPADKRKAFDREQNLFPTCCSYISNGFNDTDKSFIDSKIRELFDVTFDSVRKSQ